MAGKTLIFGNGTCARHIAQELTGRGIEVIVVTNWATQNKSLDFKVASTFRGKKEKTAEILTGARLVSCNGSAGNFSLLFAGNGEKISRTVATIIIAEKEDRKPDFSLYGIIPSPNVISLSELSQSLNSNQIVKKRFSKVKKIVFLTGLFKESNPVIAKEIMEACLKLRSDFSIQTYIMTKNLKVGSNGIEALYRETKKDGVVYIKFTDTMPDIHQDKDGILGIDFDDEITMQKFRLTPDMIVVDETIFPLDYLDDLARILKLDTDQNGFTQADNVHRLSVFSNRKGIIVAGSSRSIQSTADQVIDASNAAIAAIEPEKSDTAESKGVAEIKSGLCVRCLTCYRICPYRAVLLNTGLSVDSPACEGCGICVAHCPRGAIKFNEKGPLILPEEKLKTGDIKKDEKIFPIIYAFCCSRSAVEAGELASCMGRQLPENLRVIEVPCAGSVSYEHIFTAFKSGADGVLLLTCHEGNCHSERGNIYVKGEVEKIIDILLQIGFEQERLALKSLASNMGMEFAEIVNGFEKKIVELGPSRLKTEI
ncbi:MAG: hydrogenase iron-sulfur subunit [Deltaproteobacteria bacterium]|nr:hydrogenase iron-sulfur subunit [Deltaproteobacteria bacterium]